MHRAAEGGGVERTEVGMGTGTPEPLPTGIPKVKAESNEKPRSSALAKFKAIPEKFKSLFRGGSGKLASTSIDPKFAPVADKVADKLVEKSRTSATKDTVEGNINKFNQIMKRLEQLSTSDTAAQIGRVKSNLGWANDWVDTDKAKAKGFYKDAMAAFEKLPTNIREKALEEPKPLSDFDIAVRTTELEERLELLLKKSPDDSDLKAARERLGEAARQATPKAKDYFLGQAQKKLDAFESSRIGASEKPQTHQQLETRYQQLQEKVAEIKDKVAKYEDYKKFESAKDFLAKADFDLHSVGGEASAAENIKAAEELLEQIKV